MSAEARGRASARRRWAWARACCLQNYFQMLRSEMLVPVSSHVRDSLVAAVGLGVITVVALATEPAPRRAQITPPAVENSETVPVAVAIRQVEETAQPLHSDEIQLVFSAGGATYMKLADEPVKHGKPKLFSDEYVETAIAGVDDADVPAPHRAWKQRKVIVDGSCETTVVGFAVIGRLTGSTGYAAIDDDEWTAKNVMEQGHKFLAAKLASCTGTYARDAALPAVVVPRERKDKKLVAVARQHLAGSLAAKVAQSDWEAGERDGVWEDSEDVQWNVRVYEHPTTGATWVSAHAMVPMGCGDPEVNLWGLYRAREDGTLEVVEQKKLDVLWSIDHVLDIDNDGELEMIGKPWLGMDTVVVGSTGEELERLSLPFYGCPC